METLLEILPDKVRAALIELPLEKVYEIRLRANAPVMVCIAGRNIKVPNLVVSRVDLDNIVHKAAEYAIYSVLDQICKGFITIKGGIRLGVVGEVVVDKGVVSTIKNISGICVRIPHEVTNCSYPVLPYIFGMNRPYKTLLIAPPGAGKTTFLRDLSGQICDKYPNVNVLVLDERGELAASHLGDNQLFVGDSTDVITGGTKLYGFENGIRSMRPDVILTDEIATTEDAEMIRTATRSGVTVIASAHAADLDEIRFKPAFKNLIAEGVFERYVVLSAREAVGTVVGVYDQNLRNLRSM